MKRRICLLGAALSVTPVAFGLAAVTASSSFAKTAKPKKAAAVAFRGTCQTNVSVMIPPGESGVTPPASDGSEYGTAVCGKLGRGVQADRFTVPDSGDTLATFTWYLATGTVRGTYDLTPQQSSLNFTAVVYSGVLKVTGGTGAFAGAKGTGTMSCSSPDNIHTSCTDRLKLAKL